jgi:hypothetical protein
MQVTLKHQPAYSLAVVAMTGNEQVKVGGVGGHEGVSVGQAQGEPLGGLSLTGDKSFLSTYTAPDGGVGILAPFAQGRL